MRRLSLVSLGGQPVAGNASPPDDLTRSLSPRQIRAIQAQEEMQEAMHRRSRADGAPTPEPEYEDVEQICRSHEHVLYRGVRRSDKRRVFIKQLVSFNPTACHRMRHEYTLLQELAGTQAVAIPLRFLNTPDTLAVVLEAVYAPPSYVPAAHSQPQPPPQSQVAVVWLELLEPNGLADLERFFAAALGLTAALNALHGARVLHGSLKPSAVLLCGTHVRLLDLHAARAFHELPRLPPPPPQGVAALYHAPEDAPDYRADLWALGVLLHQLLTGALPFSLEAGTRPSGPVLRADAVRPGTPGQLADVLERLLAPQPAARYQSAAAVLHDLVRCRAAYAATHAIERFPLALGDHPLELYLPLRLHGRASVRARLLAELPRARHAAHLRLLTLSGPAGVGRARLLAELEAEVRADSGEVASAYFEAPSATGAPTHLRLLAAINALCAAVLKRPGAPERLLGLLGSDALLTLSPLLSALAPLQHSAADSPWRPRMLPLEAATLAAQKLAQLLSALASLSAPLLLCVHEAQHADPLSAALLRALLAERSVAGLLLGVTCTVASDTGSVGLLAEMREHVERGGGLALELGGLELSAVEALVADAFNVSADERVLVATALLRVTGGLPLALCLQLQRMAQASGGAAALLSYSASLGHWQCADVSELARLAPISPLQLARELPPSVAPLLGLAACIGARFSLASVARAGRHAAEHVRMHLTGAPTRAWLRPVADDVLEFAHPALHAAAYAALAPAERTRAHLRVGLLLEEQAATAAADAEAPGLLQQACGHLLRACLTPGSPDAQRVLRLAIRAAAHATNSHAPHAALALLDDARGLLPPAEADWRDERTDLLRERTRCLYLSGQLTDADASAALLLRGSSCSLAERAMWTQLRQHVATRLGRPEDAVAAGLALLEQLRVAPLPLTSASERLAAINAHLPPGRHTTLLARRLDFTQATQHHALQTLELLLNALAGSGGEQRALAVAAALKVVEVSAVDGAGPGLSVALATLADELAAAGQFERALELGDAAAQHSDAFDAPVQRGRVALAWWGEGAAWLGHPLPALVHRVRSAAELLRPDPAEAARARRVLQHLRLAAAHADEDASGPMAAALALLAAAAPPPPDSALPPLPDVPTEPVARAQASALLLQLCGCALALLVLERPAASLAAVHAARPLHARVAALPVQPLLHTLHVLSYSALHGRAAAAAAVEVREACAALDGWAMVGRASGTLVPLQQLAHAAACAEPLAALQLFDQAAGSAPGWLRALACEASAAVARDELKLPNLAHPAAAAALQLYRQLGAHAKGRLLLSRFPTLAGDTLQLSSTLLPPSSASSSPRAAAPPLTAGAAAGFAAQLDAETAVRVAQVLAPELDGGADRLFERALQLALANTPADRAIMLLEHDARLHVAAAAPAPAPPASVPWEVCDYVRRTREALVVDDVAEDAARLGLDLLGRDPALLQRPVRALLALPFAPRAGARSHSGGNRGVLYLESRAAAAFGADRVQLLQLVLSQLAISVEHAALVQELRRATQALEAKNAALKEADAMKDRFLAITSHELRTPLNGIIGTASLLAESPLAPEQREQLRVIQSSSHALRLLVNDLLDLAKLHVNKMALECIAFSLQDTLETAVSLVAPSALSKRLELALHVDCQGAPALPHVTGDPARLQQILLNLLSNAIKFTDCGGVLVTAGCTLEGGRAHLHLAVRDTGIGIAPDKLSSLFIMFSQLDTSLNRRRYGGTGIGLYLCERLVSLFGGRIWAESEGAHQGSTFHVTFSAPAVRAASAPSLPALRGRHAALVGLHEFNRTVLQHSLAHAGVAVSVPADLGALSALRDSLDLVLVDPAHVSVPLPPALQHSGRTRVVSVVWPADVAAQSPSSVNLSASSITTTTLLAASSGGSVSSPALSSTLSASPSASGQLQRVQQPLTTFLTRPLLPSKLMPALAALFPCPPASASSLPVLLIPSDLRLSASVGSSSKSLPAASNRSVSPTVASGFHPAITVTMPTPPEVRNEPKPSQPSPAPEPAPEPAPALRRAKLLIVEDNAVNHKLLCHMIQRDFDYDSAYDGREAVAKALANSYDLILMDIQMPVMDGLEATKTLRANAITTPIIAVTAGIDQANQRGCFAVGMNDFLPKPITKSEVLTVIRKWLPHSAKCL